MFKKNKGFTTVEAVSAFGIWVMITMLLIPMLHQLSLQREASEKEEEAYMRRLVKAADKLSALIKCMEEENSGNREFRTAKEATLKSIEELAVSMPEVRDFMDEFLPSYGKTLDELE